MKYHGWWRCEYFDGNGYPGSSERVVTVEASTLAEAKALLEKQGPPPKPKSQNPEDGDWFLRLVQSDEDYQKGGEEWLETMAPPEVKDLVNWMRKGDKE